MPSILPVRIEQRLGPHQVHARVVIAVDCSNVSPITRLPFHLIPEVVRIDAGGIVQRRDDVVSKIVANRALADFDQVPDENVPLKPSVITSKPANGYHFKTGQWPTFGGTRFSTPSPPDQASAFLGFLTSKFPDS